LIKANGNLDQRIANRVWNSMHHSPFPRLAFLFDHFLGFRVKNAKVDIPKKESIKELGGQV